ncbi:zinc-alpha-2-glycoprotein isoform X1 [Phyllostomus discolor]|uniref:Zinc-alpha-2-glycoprotein isoform X1 n=1 Tax=Phyllostomus discolor TaxID=89673 RepID=A0A6J2LA22_9CHIR|nr:zinc-alpha-2-glycoprotein isoform X1 [Phyllostomus discolor]
MSTMVPVLLSLLLLLGLANTQDGRYSLRFHYTGVSRPKAGFPSFQATGYLNDLAFLQYDSESGVAKPLGPWKQVKGMMDWENETQLQEARKDTFMETLKDIMNYYQDKGNHTLQGRFGCELRDNNYCGAFWTYIYDGREYIKFITQIPAWFPRQTKAVFTKQKWETEGSIQASKDYLEKECPRLLRNYLQYSKTFLDSKDAPSVSITSQVGPENIRTLKCLAYHFYPGPVSMYWTRAGLAVETDEWGDIVLSEDGNYHSWVTVKVPSSDIGPYHCRVQHSSLAEPLVVLWIEGQESQAAGTA